MTENRADIFATPTPFAPAPGFLTRCFKGKQRKQGSFPKESSFSGEDCASEKWFGKCPFLTF